jgi:hypothetical protein
MKGYCAHFLLGCLRDINHPIEAWSVSVNVCGNSAWIPPALTPMTGIIWVAEATPSPSHVQTGDKCQDSWDA